MIAPRSLGYEVDPEISVATITLCRPDRMNALTFDVYAELRDTFRALNDEEGVGAVILTGAGTAFCSGGDVEEIIGPLLEMDQSKLYDFTRMTCDVVLAIRRCRFPVIAALNGTTAGAGAVLAAACDLRVAADTARIAFLFTKVGLSGADMGIAWLLPRLIGHGRATRLLLTGAFIEAEEALEIGLYNWVVEPDTLEDTARDIARRLARGPAEGMAATKRALDDEWTMTLEDALENEARVQAERMLDPAFRQAYEAWCEKRGRRSD